MRDAQVAQRAGDHLERVEQTVGALRVEIVARIGRTALQVGQGGRIRDAEADGVELDLLVIRVLKHALLIAVGLRHLTCIAGGDGAVALKRAGIFPVRHEDQRLTRHLIGRVVGIPFGEGRRR